jgi:hypothetical protein
MKMNPEMQIYKCTLAASSLYSFRNSGHARPSLAAASHQTSTTTTRARATWGGQEKRSNVGGGGGRGAGVAAPKLPPLLPGQSPAPPRAAPSRPTTVPLRLVRPLLAYRSPRVLGIRGEALQNSSRLSSSLLSPEPSEATPTQGAQVLDEMPTRWRVSNRLIISD